MKHFIKSSLLLLLILGFGCSDFLDVRPQSELTQEAFPTTEADAVLATNAVYTTLRSWHYNSGGFPILDIMSDDALKGSNPDDASSTLGPYDNFTMNTNQDGLNRWWTTLYQGIRYANIVIEYVPNITMDTNLRARLVAEAHFLRALYYFDAVRAWGGVPLVTAAEAPVSVQRSSADEIYALIEADLQAAIADLPLKRVYGEQDLGRASKGAAQALLGKVYLFRGNFQAAETQLLAVINSGEYDLEDNFYHANSREGEHGVESVFEVGAAEVSSSIGNQYANTQGVRGTPNRGWGFNQPSVDLRNAFENNDPREQATIIELGDVIDGITILGDGTTPDVVRDENNNIVAIESYNRKVWIPGTSTNTQFGHNRRLLRYSDVLLMAAEALNENDKASQALPYLNQVRIRARGDNPDILPNITETNKASLRDIILHERRVELALEGHRFWDLVRTNKAAEVLGPLGFQTGKHELLPIPQEQIDLSMGTLTQNPNWN